MSEDNRTEEEVFASAIGVVSECNNLVEVVEAFSRDIKRLASTGMSLSVSGFYDHPVTGMYKHKIDSFLMPHEGEELENKLQDPNSPESISKNAWNHVLSKLEERKQQFGN